jgi:proline dehydrogenase
MGSSPTSPSGWPERRSAGRAKLRFVASDAALESEIHRIGSELAHSFPSLARHPVKALDDRAMELASRDAELRAALFRFVDVVPACRSLEDLARHLSAYLGEVDERPPPLEVAMRMADSKAGSRALGLAAAAGVRHMAHRFIVGETPQDALDLLEALWRSGVASSVDLLGEATVTVEEAERYANRCADALRTLAGASATWPAQPRLERDSTGAIPRVNLSVKVSALTPLLRPEAPEVGKQDAAGRLRTLMRLARELSAHLHIDMESLDTSEIVMALVLDLLSEDEFGEAPSAGVVLQAYLRDSPEMLERVLDWASAHPRAYPLVVRLVKGAYWDHEIVEARRHGWPAPVFEDKSACDRNFEALTRRLLDARPLVRVAIASHNLRSVSHAIACNRHSGGDDSDLELQVLRGLGDDLQHALAKAGFRVRTYCPVGDLVAGMAYLVRRLLENTSNESFLAAQSRGVDLEELLVAP